MRHPLLALTVAFNLGASPPENRAASEPSFAHLRSLKGKHTEELFKDPLASQALKELTGVLAYEELLKVTEVAANMTLHEDRFLKASGCMPHACNLAGGLVVIDVKSTDILVVLYPIVLDLQQNVYISNPSMDLPIGLDKEIAAWKARYWQMK